MKEKPNKKPIVRDDIPAPQGFRMNASKSNSTFLNDILAHASNTDGNISPEDSTLPPPSFSYMDDGNHGSSEGFEREASFERNASFMMGSSPQVSRTPLMYVDPLFDPILMLFPVGDIQALNERLRHYYNHHPLVGNIIDLHSFHPDTLIMTKDGLKEITDCKEDDYILDDTGNYQKVLEKGNHINKREMVRLYPSYLSSLDITDNHPVWRIKSIKCKKAKGIKKNCSRKFKPDYDSGEWVFASELKKNDFVVYPKFKVEKSFDDIDLTKYITNENIEFDDKYIWNKNNSKKKQFRYIKVDEKLSEFFGWYCFSGMADVDNDEVIIENVLDEVDYFHSLIKEIFNINAITVKDRNESRTFINSSVVCEFLKRESGNGDYNKKIPYFILQNNKESAFSFFNSIREEGNFKDIFYNVKSKELALQIQMLFSKIDILIDCNANAEFDKYIKNTKDCVFEDENNFYCLIDKIKKYKYDGMVWDLKTETKTIQSPFKVHNSEFPLSDFSLETSDPAITRFYNDFKDKIGLLNLLVDMNKEYWLLGEAIRYGNWNLSTGMWDSFVSLAPERVEIYSTQLTNENLFYLKPDPDIKKKLNSSDPRDIAILKHTDQDYLNAVRENRSFRLDNNRLMYMARKGPGDRRGTTIMRRVLKDLVYEDKLRLLQYTFCFVPHTKVIMSDGTELAIRDVKVGDEVITHTGEKKEVVFKHERDYEGDLIEITSKDGNVIRCTPEHPFFVIENGKSIVKNANELSLKDTLAFPMKDKNEDGDLEISRLTGYFLAIGSYECSFEKGEKTTKVVFSFHKDKESYIDDIKLILKKENILSEIIEGENETIVKISDEEIVFSLQKFIGDCIQFKKLSSEIFEWSYRELEQMIVGFLRGLHSTCKDKNIEDISFSFSSDELQKQMKLILSFLGIGSKINKVKGIRKYKLKDFFSEGKKLLKKAFDISFSSKEKNGVGIEKIDVVSYSGKVYNLEVKDIHSYVIEGNISVHNCDRHMFPIKIFKLGSESQGWIPPQSHFDSLRNLLTASSGDPDFNILYHWGLQVDYIGTKDKIENLIPHFDWVEKRIMAGLFANDALVHGQATTYASAANSTRILMHKYLTQRAQLEQIVTQSIFLPMAKAHGFVKRTQAEMSHKVRTSTEYILPKYVWQKLNLLSNTTQQQLIATLRSNGEIPFKYVADLFGWDANDVKEALAKEKGTMLDKNYRELREEKEKENRDDFLKGQGIKNLLAKEEPKEEDQLEFDMGQKPLPRMETPMDSPGRIVDRPEIPVERDVPLEERDELPREVGGPEVS